MHCIVLPAQPYIIFYIPAAIFVFTSKTIVVCILQGMHFTHEHLDELETETAFYN